MYKRNQSVGVYEDTASDAGYAYGTDENQQMAQSIKHIERQNYDKAIAEAEETYYSELEEERRKEILFYKFDKIC